MSYFTRARAFSAALFGGTLLTTPLVAQVQPQEALSQGAVSETAMPESEGSVIVTGTRIARPDLTTASPVSVVGQQELQLRQNTTAEQLLTTLPSVRPNTGAAVNNGSDGSSTLELRGIGPERTLVLIDGRRVVPFGLDNFVDTNVVPLALIERVDVLTGSASSTYGADAVAGAVNFVTKKNFSGVDASARYRITERGDARQYQGDLVIGSNLDDGRGNVVLDIGYLKRSPLLTTNRPYGQVPINSATGIFSGISGSGPVTIFTSPVNTAPFGRVVDPATGTLRAATQADVYNTQLFTLLQTPLQRYNAFASARYEISKAVEVYATGMFTRNETRLQLAPSGTFTNTYYLPLNNPYLPAGVRNELCAAGDFNPNLAGTQTLTPAQCATAAAVVGGPGTPGYAEAPVIAQRRFAEYGARGQSIISNMFQVQAGLRGEITSNIRYDLSGQYGETRQNQTRVNWGSYSRVQQALRAYRTAGGSPICSDTSNGCVPINLFGPTGSITPDQIAFFDLDSLTNRVVRLEVVTGTISGDLFGLTSPLAAKPIAFAIGGEYRHISSRAQPDQAAQVQSEVLGTGARTPPDFGQYDVKEIFAELNAPLVSDKPFIYNLSAEAGVRFSDYSTTGKSTTWKAGGQYEPIRGIKFRGTYSVAVRSPNILELFQSSVTGLSSLAVDPCQGTLPNANAGLRALCIATGAPASVIGNINSPTSNQINATQSGNRNLDVERANTYTFGAVLTPTFVPRFSATIDYFNIKVKDAITRPAAADILNGCYSAALNPSFTYNAFCQLIGRNPLNGTLNGAGETPGVILSASNLGRIETAGVDFNVNYKVDFADFGIKRDIGSLSFSLSGTWLNYYHFQANPIAINRDCTARYSATGCTNPRPGWKYNTRVTYSYGPFDLSVLWRHIGSVGLEPFQATATQPLTTPQPGGPNPSTVLPAFRRIDAYNYFDLAVRAGVTDNIELTLTVDNLLDKQPPVVGNGVGGTAFNGTSNTFPTIYDTLGRTFTVGVRAKF